MDEALRGYYYNGEMHNFQQSRVICIQYHNK